MRRCELLSIRQDHRERIRSFYAWVNGKAATCAYSKTCTGHTCTQEVDFTDVIVKDVMVTGLADDDIKKEVLGWTELDHKGVLDTVAFIEGKEMARDSLDQRSTTSAAISSYKVAQKLPTKPARTRCDSCHIDMERHFWSRRQGKMIERSLCLTCWQKANPRRPKQKPKGALTDNTKDGKYNKTGRGRQCPPDGS